MEWSAEIKVFKDSEKDQYGKITKEGGKELEVTVKASSSDILIGKINTIMSTLEN